ncbi:TIGR00159 family protein [candidate division WOR-3 bacterium]|nr:TIGR00159 family protein [candidate division WOR-3 bacterium]
MFSFLKFQFSDVIDILIVALVVYYFLRFLKGTRAIRMLYALAFLVAVSLVARWLDFKALGMIVGSLTTVWIVAFVIIFQPEIRTLLARFGRLRPLRYLLRQQADAAVVDEVVEAASQLRELRWGALIVLEREIGLREYIETGTRIDARVSASLLVSLFAPSAPLHDGAAVVAGPHVVAAGCTLPLSDLTFQEGPLGMRHRAGLGITAATDAVSVIVSEGGGRISFARRGRLLLGLTPSQLKYNITQTLQKEA